MNDENTQDVVEIPQTDENVANEGQTTETVVYEQRVTESLDNLVNISLFNGFFLGCILGALIITLFWKRINP